MMAPFDTDLLKHTAQRHQLPDTAERIAARARQDPQYNSRPIPANWLEVIRQHVRRLLPASGHTGA